MKFELYSKIALKEDLVKYGLKKGDVAVIIEEHPAINGQAGFTLEVFNALGDTIAIPTVTESQIELLRDNEIFNIRYLNISKVAEPPENYS